MGGVEEEVRGRGGRERGKLRGLRERVDECAPRGGLQCRGLEGPAVLHGGDVVRRARAGEVRGAGEVEEVGFLWVMR